MASVSVISIPYLSIFAALCSLHKKNYCFPSQNKIKELLQRFQSVDVSLRTINRHLLAIKESGYIKRTRRIKRCPQGGFIFQSTLYRIDMKGFTHMFKLGFARKVGNKVYLDKKKADAAEASNVEYGPKAALGASADASGEEASTARPDRDTKLVITEQALGEDGQPLWFPAYKLEYGKS